MLLSIVAIETKLKEISGRISALGEVTGENFSRGWTILPHFYPKHGLNKIPLIQRESLTKESIFYVLVMFVVYLWQQC